MDEPGKRDARLAHDGAAIYRTYDRIFNCSSHGWSNLQSTHINLPFANDEEFARLHAALRVVIPVLPALAAASPYADGHASGMLDYRMEVYRRNADAIPELNGDIVPEPVTTRAEYERNILAPMYGAIAPYDPEGLLRHEWLNARGAIARFDRNAIEVRVLDTQEWPQVDVAFAAIIWILRKAFAKRRSTGRPQTRNCPHACSLKSSPRAPTKRIKRASATPSICMCSA